MRKAKELKRTQDRRRSQQRLKEIKKNLENQRRIIIRSSRGLEVKKAPSAGFLKRQERRRDQLRQKIETGKKLTAKEQAELAGRTALQTAGQAAVGFVTLPKTALDLVKNPSKLKKVPREIAREGKKFGRLLRVSPTEAFVKIGTEIFVAKGAGETLRITGKVVGNTATKLSPKFKAVKGGEIAVNKNLNLKLKTIGKGQSLKKQLATQEGKILSPTSVQADRLVNFLQRKKVVRKPIPGEENFKASTKSLLKKFDEGKITKKGLSKLNKDIIKQTGDKSLLERSFFADPDKGIRFTRLSDEGERASLLDVLSGDYTTKVTKPQVLVFNKQKIAKIPKSLKDISKKLKQGKKINEAERLRLVEWQLRRTGKFKPIGDVRYRGGIEQEVTLAPGEIIKRKKKLGTTILDGKRVEIIEAEVFKPGKKLKKSLDDFKKGKLTKKEIRELEKELTKKTNIKTKLGTKKVSRRKGSRKRLVRKRPGVRLKRKGTVRGRRKKPQGARRSPPRRSPPRRRTPITPRRPSAARRRTPSTPRRPSAARSRKAPSTRTRLLRGPRAARRSSSKRKKKKASKEVKGYNVYAKPIKSISGKKTKRLLKVNKTPLTKKKAEDLRNYVIDTSLGRTGKITPTTKKPTKTNIRVPKGYAKRTLQKFRTSRIIKGKKRKLSKGTVIEKRKRLLDTRGERRKISVRKRIAQVRRPRKRKTSRRKKRR